MDEEELEPAITDEIIESSVEPKSEEKGYLARDEFTSERFKLELNNLPKYFGFGVSVILLIINLITKKSILNRI
jgi:hypothetical protein